MANQQTVPANQQSVQTTASGIKGKVAKNAIVMFAAQIISWIATIISISIIPRTVGEVGMGNVATITIYTGFMCGFLTFSIDTYLTKEIGKDRSASERLVNASIGLRLVCAPVMFLLALLGVYLAMRIEYPRLPFNELMAIPKVRDFGLLGLFGATAIIPIFMSNALLAAMLGWEDSKSYAVAFILMTSSSIMALPFLQWQAFAVQGAILTAYSLTACYALWWWSRKIKIRPTFDFKLWKEMIVRSIPYHINFYLLYFFDFTSVTALKMTSGAGAVGEYNQATKLSGLAIALPTALTMVLLPSLMRIIELAEEEFARTQKQVVAVLLVLGLPITILLMLLASPISHFLYGSTKYVNMPIAIQAMAINILPTYIITALYQFMVASGRATHWTKSLMLTAVINVICCAVFAPIAIHFQNTSVTGVLMASFASQFCGMLMAFKITGLNPFDREIRSRLGNTILPTCGLIIAVWIGTLIAPEPMASTGLMNRGGGLNVQLIIRQALAIIVPAVVGLGTFFVLGIMLGLFTQQERNRLFGFVKSKLARNQA